MQPDHNDKELYSHLGLLSDEVHRIKDLLGKVTSRECEVKGILDELAPAKQSLADRIGHVESMIKQAAAAAISEADEEKDIMARIEQERAELASRLREKEGILKTHEAAITELEEKLTSKDEDLEKEITQKNKLLEMRDAMLANLASTTTALNLFAENLKSLEGAEVILLGQTEEGYNENGTGADRPIEEDSLGRELEKLRSDLREKEVRLEAREVEIESLKQSLGARIEELERLLKKTTLKKRTPGFVSYLADLGEKD